MPLKVTEGPLTLPKAVLGHLGLTRPSKANRDHFPLLNLSCFL